LSATPNGKHHEARHCPETPWRNGVGRVSPRRTPGSTMGWQPSLPAEPRRHICAAARQAHQ